MVFGYSDISAAFGNMTAGPADMAECDNRTAEVGDSEVEADGIAVVAADIVVVDIARVALDMDRGDRAVGTGP